MDKFWENLLGQILALITFFAFPAIQYLLLKRFAKKEGRPELWYLPDYGFRLVIRNLPRKKTFSDIKYRAFLRKLIPASSGASVATYVDKPLLQNDDMFLFPGNDQILISFSIEEEGEENLHFVYTDKLSHGILRVPMSDFTILISDYTANLENWFNFDVKVSKRVELSAESLRDIWSQIRLSNHEQRFDVSRVRDIR